MVRQQLEGAGGGRAPLSKMAVPRTRGSPNLIFRLELKERELKRDAALQEVLVEAGWQPGGAMVEDAAAQGAAIDGKDMQQPSPGLLATCRTAADLQDGGTQVLEMASERVCIIHLPKGSCRLGWL